MPSGETHETFESFCLAPIVAIGMYINYNYYPLPAHMCLLFVGSYVFSIFFLSPDLDLSRCRSRRNWGALGILWEPYARFFSHRGLSHSFLWGTWSRVLYLGIIGGILWGGVGLWQGWPLPEKDTCLLWIQNHSAEITACFLGLTLPDVFHIFLDQFLRN